MQKKLNIVKVQEIMTSNGLSQSNLAEALDVSREAISQWLNNKSFPRPNKLLQLGKLLSLSFDELVIKDDSFAPRIAFRKVKGAKTQNHHIKKAQEIGRFLKQLVPFLPFDMLKMPPVLKSPNCDYDYLRKVTSKIREDNNLEADGIIDFTHLIRLFRDLQAVIVPVLWGSKQRHENAVHIYLPDSQTTWIYLNLDTNIHDFKFWMAHELGHCLSPSLEGDEAEDFADAFAAALLFPHELAEKAYTSITSQPNNAAKISHVLQLANSQTISPYTVIKQVNKFAEHTAQPEIDINNSFPGAVTNFNKKFLNLSDALLKNKSQDNKKNNAKDFISIVETAFETPFFDLLRQYIKSSNKSASFIQVVLDISPLDAKSIHTELT